MHWTLSSAALRCSRRRAGRAAAAGPLVAALVVALLLALPLLALLAGRQIAPFVAAAATDGALAKAFALSVVGPALVLGVAFAALAPDDRLLGQQLTAAPVGRVARFVSLTLVPLAIVLAPFAVPLLVGSAAASADAPAGRWLAMAIVGAVAASAACGAASAAAAAVAMRSVRWLPLLGAPAVVWLAVGFAGGEPLLGPAASVGRAVAGDPLEAAGCALIEALAAAVGTGLWTCASLAPAGGRERGNARLRVALPARPMPAVASATLLRLARNAQIRRHVLIACVVAVAGAAILRAVGVPEVGASFLPLAAALVAAAALPPAAVAFRRDGEWLLRACPARLPAIVRAVAAASVIAAAAVVVAVVGAAAPLVALERSLWPLAETSAAIVLAAAVVGGSLVPWRPDRVVEQTVSYVVVGTLAAVLSFAVSRGAAEAVSLGVPELAFVTVAANGALAASIALAGVFER